MRRPSTEAFSWAQSCTLGQLGSPGRFLHAVEFVEFPVELQSSADAKEMALKMAAA
jgi:hypothetical protein